MVRSMLLVAAVIMITSLSHAQAPSSVQVTGVVGGCQLAVAAANNGKTFVGAGKLTAPNSSFYNLKVTSGSVQQGRYVSLQGALLAPNGAVAAPFTLIGDGKTGAIVFSYTVNGRVIKQTANGAVVIK